MLALRAIRQADTIRNHAWPFLCRTSLDRAPIASFHPRSYSGLYEEFDVFSGVGGGRVIINSYNDTGFTANGVKVDGSIICLGKMVFSWNARSLEDISPGSLAIFQLLRPAPELLVVGCGKTMARIGTDVRDYLKSNGIKIEVIDTRNAASTFNILNEEGRQVAAAMLPYGSQPQTQVA